MIVLSPRRTLLSLSLVVAQCATSYAQTAAPAGATAAWTIKTKGEVRWQQVTPAGALLISTDAELAGVDIERGQVTWEKPELAGVPADSVRVVEGSLLMEAARPGLLIVFDPVTGAVVFDSRRLSLAQVVTRRVLPQSGTLLVHGRRAAGPPVVALYDLATGLAGAKLVAVGFGIVLHLRRVHTLVAFLTLVYVAVAILPWTALFLAN